MTEVPCRMGETLAVNRRGLDATPEVGTETGAGVGGS